MVPAVDNRKKGILLFPGQEGKIPRQGYRLKEGKKSDSDREQEANDFWFIGDCSVFFNVLLMLVAADLNFSLRSNFYKLPQSALASASCPVLARRNGDFVRCDLGFFKMSILSDRAVTGCARNLAHFAQ